MTPQAFQKMILTFYRQHRRVFPWRRTRDPYRILVSEIMLQQTQAERVVPKYLAFLTKFPTFASLVRAKLVDVLKVWQGLGYNRRAMALKELSRIVMLQHKGRLPKDPQVLVELPGVGPYTAGAIAAFAWNIPTVFIETNIRRTYLHHFFPKKQGVSDKKLFPIIEKTIVQTNPREWYYALMDYGAALAKQVENANKRSKHYVVQSKFDGSARQLRGKLISLLLQHKAVPVSKTLKLLAVSPIRFKTILRGLQEEGFLQIKKGLIRLSG